MSQIGRIKQINLIRKQLKLNDFDKNIAIKKICLKCKKAKYFYDHEIVLICEKCKK